MLKNLAKLGIDIVEGGLARAGRAVGLVDFPPPRNSHIRKTGGRWLVQYHQAGIRSYLPIATMALANGVDLNGGARVLDFGCGVGRQLGHFVKRYPRASYAACDVDADMIAFIRKAFPGVDAYANQFRPPLKWTDAAFDLTYTVSTFSHFSPDDVAVWLAELARVLRPGGLLMITTEGEVAARADPRQLTAQMMDEAREAGVSYREYTWLEAGRGATTLGGVGDGTKGIASSYGNTILTPAYVGKVAGEAGLSVAAHSAGVIDHRQDLYVLRKEGSGRS